MNLSRLKHFFDETVSEQVLRCACKLDGTSSFHNPLVWRTTIPELASLDFHGRKNGLAYSAMQMMEVFRIFGELSLDLRDVPGLGHGRILSIGRGNRWF